MPSLSGHSNQRASTAEYLADREGLDGAARVVFMRLLRDVFGFRITRPRRIASLLAMTALTLAGFGTVFEVRDGLGAEAALPWLGIGGLGVALAIAVARDSDRIRSVNREYEWRAYCLLVRPVILLRRPGLLDRNLRADRGADEKFEMEPARAMLSTLRERNPDCWMSAAAGWLVGSLAAVVWRVMAGREPWLIGIPVCGAALGPPVWSVLRTVIFYRLQRAATRRRT